MSIMKPAGRSEIIFCTFLSIDVGLSRQLEGESGRARRESLVGLVIYTVLRRMIEP